MLLSEHFASAVQPTRLIIENDLANFRDRNFLLVPAHFDGNFGWSDRNDLPGRNTTLQWIDLILRRQQSAEQTYDCWCREPSKLKCVCMHIALLDRTELFEDELFEDELFEKLNLFRAEADRLFSLGLLNLLQQRIEIVLHYGTAERRIKFLSGLNVAGGLLQQLCFVTAS